MPQSPAPPAFHIVSGDEAREYVGWKEILHFSSQVALSMHDQAPIAFSKTREALRTLINAPGSVLFNRSNQIDRLYPYPTNTEAISAIYREIRQMLRDNTLFAAVEEKTLAGLGGYMPVGDEEGRNVIELKRTVLNPAMRGNGLYKALADTRLQHIEEELPHSLVISATRQPSVVRWALHNGFTEIDWRRFYIDLKKFTFNAFQDRAFAGRVETFGWKYYEREAGAADRD